jgi:crotonobetainyl-CoA:carnitine CoA-transferase CaiB-like acyl-CoA transferase
MLTDCLVLECASVLAGPSVGQFFAEQGATVLKIENPRTGGDVTRRWRVPNASSSAPSDDRSAYFCACNHGKRSVAIDLSTGDGQALLHRLAAQADVVLSSFRPGTAAALGADYQTLSALRPSLIYGHVTGYGPNDARAGYDAVIQAETGFMHMNGPAEGPPTKLPVALMDVLAAHHLKEALLLALLRRERTGAGTYAPVSLQQAAVSALANQATNWLVGGYRPQRMGSAHPNIAPYGTAYATADGAAIVLAVGTDRQFEALCDVLEQPELATRDKFATNTQRVANRKSLARVLERQIATMNAEELLEALHSRNVPAGRIRTVPDVFAQAGPQAVVLNPAEEPPGLRQMISPAFPPPDGLLAPPPYAAHTDAVLRDHLQMTAERREELDRAGVIERRNESGH